MSYIVEQWASDHIDGLVDCIQSSRHDRLELARQEYDGKFPSGTKYILLAQDDPDGVSVLDERGNPDFVQSSQDDNYDRKELAMLAGMAGGCGAYNEEMGWE